MFSEFTAEEQPALRMRFGVIIVREFDEFVGNNIQELTERLALLGCIPSNILMRSVPTLHDALIATNFFAQYTDVDGVIILAPQNRAMGTLSFMNGISTIQIQWNMVVEIGGAECADHIVEMITLQNEMEDAAPEISSRSRCS